MTHTVNLCELRAIVALRIALRARDTDRQESLALASMARDDPPASSTASSTAPLSTAPASSTAAAMRGKVGSEFET